MTKRHGQIPQNNIRSVSDLKVEPDVAAERQRITVLENQTIVDERWQSAMRGGRDIDLIILP